MRTLYHFALCPFSRKIRLMLKEKDIAHEPITEPFWEDRAAFLELNPLGNVPVFIEEDMHAYVEHVAITEYLEEVYPEIPLYGTTPQVRAETRRICNWFDHYVYADAVQPVVEERVYKYLRGQGEPDTRRLQQAYRRLPWHMEQLVKLLRQRPWLSGDAFSLADISVAAHLSVLDYFSEIHWQNYPSLKDWYAIIKSRPSFRPLLFDRVPGFKPAAHYADLDF